MLNQHPITPPPELLKQWMQAARNAEKTGGPFAKTFAMAAINWALAQTHPIIRSCSKHPISPTDELINAWGDEWSDAKVKHVNLNVYLAVKAAQWGADQELEACINYFYEYDRQRWGENSNLITGLRAARRPKPTSLKEQALKELDDWTLERHGLGGKCFICDGLSVATIRRALEALDD